MKKLILSLSLLFVGSQAMSQIIFSVEAPASISGAYTFSGNDDGSSWGLASLAGVQVIDTVVIVDDGTPGTNAQGNPIAYEGCNALTNNLTGKIAMVYRNTCGFGVKALNAQNAGAIAVIIVNREEAIINMNGGTEGASVTIPVVFVTASTGLAMRQQIDAGTKVVAFIGDKTGFFANDFSIYDNRSLRANVGAIPSAIAQDATQFNVPIGTWAYNFGQNAQTGVRMTADVSRNGTSVFSQTTTGVSLPVGDSVYLTTPNFSLATYPIGDYELKYTVISNATDEYLGDNEVISKFSITTDLWSLARLDTTATKIVAADNFYRSNTLPANSFKPCVVLNSANASSLTMQGLYFGGVVVGVADTATVNVNNQFLTASLSRWDDADKGTTTATYTSVLEVATGDFSYVTESPDSTIYIPFTNAYTMIDNVSYLACVQINEPKLFTPFADKDFYDENILQNDVTRFPVFADNAPVAAGVGFGIPASIAAKITSALAVNENTIETSTFPNPTKDVITVKVNASGSALLNVTDLAGRIVSTENVKIVGGQFTTNVAGMSAGTYVFSLEFANGTSSRFNVVVAK